MGRALRCQAEQCAMRKRPCLTSHPAPTPHRFALILYVQAGVCARLRALRRGSREQSGVNAVLVITRWRMRRTGIHHVALPDREAELRLPLRIPKGCARRWIISGGGEHHGVGLVLAAPGDLISGFNAQRRIRSGGTVVDRFGDRVEWRKSVMAGQQRRTENYEGPDPESFHKWHLKLRAGKVHEN